jgi:hypothetical protein
MLAAGPLVRMATLVLTNAGLNPPETSAAESKLFATTAVWKGANP